MVFIAPKPTIGNTRNWIRDQFGLRGDWFALERIDGVLDDKTKVNGVWRGEFRLHPGSVSLGCVTCVPGAQYNDLVKEIKNAPFGYIPYTDRRYYGILHVKSSETTEGR